MAAGEKLHKFDLQLCDYVVGTIHGHLDDERFRCLVDARIKEPLRSHLLDHDSTEKHLLLSDEDLCWLWEAFRDTPMKFCWVRCNDLHRRYVNCVTEIREELTKQEAEEWSKVSVDLAKRLEQKGLSLGEGIKIVHEWVDNARRLLRAMEAAHFLPVPEGTFPTPTRPKPAESRKLADQVSHDVIQMREAIAKHPKKNKASATALIKAAHINPKRGRDALRELQQMGEYEGFARPRHPRYQEKSPKQH